MAKVTKQTLTTYDPQKNYQWKPEDSFELSGQDFSFLIQFITKEVLTPEGTTSMDKVNAYQILQNLLVSAVEQGIAVEVRNNSDNKPDPYPEPNVREGELEQMETK